LVSSAEHNRNMRDVMLGFKSPRRHRKLTTDWFAKGSGGLGDRAFLFCYRCEFSGRPALDETAVAVMVRLVLACPGHDSGSDAISEPGSELAERSSLGRVRYDDRARRRGPIRGLASSIKDWQPDLWRQDRRGAPKLVTQAPGSPDRRRRYRWIADPNEPIRLAFGVPIA
jgi:hypothetical protein